MRRDLNRANTAVGVVLAVVLTFAVVAVFAGLRAARNSERAFKAEADSTERLWNSYLAQASALRLTATAGRRANALDVINNAAAIRPDGILRTEAAATLALTDLTPDGETIKLPRSDSVEIDVARRQFAYGVSSGLVFLGKTGEDTNTLALDGRSLGAGFREPVQNVTFSPDGKIVCVRHLGGTLALWDVATRRVVFQAGSETTNLVLAGMIFTPDLRTFYFSDPDSARQITQLDMTTFQRVQSGLVVGARMFRFRPATSQVAIVRDSKVEIYNYPTNVFTQTFEHPARVFVIAWSPDGEHLAVSCEDGDVHLWNVPQGTHLLLRGHTEPCLRLGFSPDSRLVFTGSRDGTTRLWNTTQGLLVASAEDGMGQSFNADGSRLGFVRFAPSIGSWQVNRSDCFASLVCPTSDGTFNGMDLSTDGRWCVAAQSKGIRVWDLNANAREKFFPLTGLISARIAPDGKSFFICRTNALERWPLTENELGEIKFGAPEKIPLPDNVGARFIAITQNGQTAAVELSDLRFATIDLTGQALPVIFPERWRAVNQKGAGSPTGPGRFAISPDGRWICTGYWLGADDVPRVWDARTATVVTKLAMGTSLAAFSGDGQWLALSGQGEFQIYATTNWQRVQKIPRDEFSFAHGSLAFVGNRGQVALTRTRQQVQLCSTEGQEKFLNLIPPSVQSVSSLRVSADGNVLAIGSARDVIQIWRLNNLHAALAKMNLDWGAPSHSALPAAKEITATPKFGSRLMFTLGGGGFLLVAALSLFALRRHRAAIENFFSAEAKSAERNRALEAAKFELMQSQKMQALGTLAAGIAHDFNNLLSVIRMSNKLVGRQTKENVDVQENVADIEQAVLQGKNVVSSMLGYARSENETTGPLDISAAVEETVSLLSKEFLSGITLTLELNRRAPLVSIARGQVEQMVLNLVVNASEAMQGKGKLKISVHPHAALPAKNFILRPEPAAQFLELAVTDSGPGIPPEIRDRLFEPFFTTKRSGAKAGTGLGLSLVYSIAQQEKLGLNVESEPGKGAAFSIYFPLKS